MRLPRSSIWFPVFALAVAGCDCNAPLDTDPAGGNGGDVSSGGGGSGPVGGAGGENAEGGGGAEPMTSTQLYLQLGLDVPPAIAERVRDHLAATHERGIIELGPDDPAPSSPHSTLFAFGETTGTSGLISSAEVDALDDEGYILRSGASGQTRVLAAIGRPGGDQAFGEGAIGSAYGAYALLEHVGFSFLHPLAPTRPEAVDVEVSDVDETSSPRWPIRGLQLHTMHPLELTNLLQGWGPEGPDDPAGWADMLPDWDAFLEWSIANGQNRAHWVLLWAEPWGAFGDSSERLGRLTTLVDRAHDFAFGVGIDTPLRQQQQHTFRLIRTDGTIEQDLEQIRTRVDWLMGAGFDYMSTENGSTEFTSTDDVRTVAWMDELTSHLADQYGKSAFVKIHTSTGQTVANYTDPQTGGPLNFNHLPHYADARLGIMPHTVQHYALSDPAPTYGNASFEYVRTFLQEEVGLRPVVWHPETAYWVSFDVDVPLLLPVYAHRRLHDLRVLREDEDAGRMGRGEHAGEHMDGQLTFSSGWEWGYWLQEVITARAAWAPPENPDDDAALRLALAPVVRPFGSAAEPIRELIVELSRAQLELLIEGRVNGVAPSDPKRRNGQAYLQGFEAWDDLSELAEAMPNLDVTMTQPQRLGLLELRSPFHAPPGYSAVVEPLLAEMEERFGAIAMQLEALRPQIPDNALSLYEDLATGAEVLALRAKQIHGLYDYVDAYWDGPESFKTERLQAARDALDEALILVTAHEANYRVDPDRIAAWRDNPTAYEFGYLWTVRSLYYWWRDEAKAVDAPLSPCYLNIINPATLAMGEGSLSSATDTLAEVFENTSGIGSATECAGVAGEPTLPPPGLRD